MDKKKKSSDIHQDYYEAILQVRPADPKIVDFVHELVESRNDVTISKIVAMKTGCDIYLSNQRFARGTLASQLKKKYKNGKITISKALYGQHKMTSRLVYRATILFRLNEE